MKKIKALLNSVKYKLSFLGVLNSPLKGLKLKWYFGNIKHGTPYFLPGKWVKCNKEDAIRAWVRINDKMKKIYIDKWGNEDEYYDYYIRTFNKPVPIEVEIPIGFMNCGISTCNHFIADTNNSANWDTLKFPLPIPKYKWNISHYKNKGDKFQKKIVVLVDCR